MWHELTLRDISGLLASNPDVLVLAVVGSGAQGRLDAWSDLDLLMVVQPDALRSYYPSLAWLAPAGAIYAFEQNENEFRSVSRVCFADMRRIDLLVTTEEALQRVDHWPRIPFAGGSRIIFSRSAIADAVLSHTYRPALPVVSETAFEELVNGFLFKAMLATNKVVRGDLLVAVHLSLDLLRDCAVLALWARDRAEGRTHGHGNSGSETMQRLQRVQRPFTPIGVLDGIQASARLFDELAGVWSPAYGAQSEPLLEWIGAARTTVHSAATS